MSATSTPSIIPHSISVIIAAYNHAKYLLETLESIFAQQYAPIQIIVVNDGSSDNTAEVAAKYAGRIIYIEQANQGASGARNAGLPLATGEFIHFLDADDYVLPGFYQKVVDVFARRPEISAVYSGCRRVDQAGNFLIDYPPNPELADVFHELFIINLWTMSVMVVRSAALREVGPFDPSVNSCEDWDLWLRFALQGKKFASAGGTYVCYRQHPTNTSRNPKLMLLTGLKVINHYARLHHCPKCKIFAKRGRQNWREFCYQDKVLPRLDAFLDQGKTYQCFAECARIFLYDPPSALKCWRRFTQRKRQVLAGLLGQK